MNELHSSNNLVICQKSKINDWLNHFKDNYNNYTVFDLTNKIELENYINSCFNCDKPIVGIINYDLVYRRLGLLKIENFTLLLDESSIIQNETSKRSKFILKLKPDNVILLSGTPCSGSYENLWSQMKLLGWDISKKMYYTQYVDMKMSDDGYWIINGYKNVDRLKRKMREHGCIFMKTEEVIDLPNQNFITINVNETEEYKHFKKHGIVELKDEVLVGDNTLTKMLYSRMLCGHYNKNKIEAVKDLINSTNDRLIIFYNFIKELEILKTLTGDRPISEVNGSIKDLSNYEKYDNSITFVQYQSGSMGINLQKANKIIYFTPTLSCEHWMQSLKRIHRINQDRPCYYYLLKSGIDYRVYSCLDRKVDYTDDLFLEDLKNEW